MAWTAPRTYTAGEIITASILNSAVRDNLRYLKGLDGAVTLSDALILPDGAGRYLHIPILTTAQRDALTATAGMLIYNSTTTQFNKYENGAWRADLGFNSHHGDLSGLTDDDHTQYQKESLLTTAGDIAYATGDSAWARLGIGAASQLLRTNAGATAPEWTTGVVVSKIKAETRDMTAASGDVAYTGYGFAPKGLIIYSIYGTSGTRTSFGFGDSSLAETCLWTGATGGSFTLSTTTIIELWESAGVTQSAVLKTLDAAGFTLTWTKAGSPGAATANLLVFAVG